MDLPTRWRRNWKQTLAVEILPPHNSTPTGVSAWKIFSGTPSTFPNGCSSDDARDLLFQSFCSLPLMNRRQFLARSTAFATAHLAGSSLLASSTPLHVPKGKAEHCIFIWLGGGMSQLDTFDPKRR